MSLNISYKIVEINHKIKCIIWENLFFFEQKIDFIHQIHTH